MTPFLLPSLDEAREKVRDVRLDLIQVMGMCGRSSFSLQAMVLAAPEG